MKTLLPGGFSALEPFASTWAGATAFDRDHLRSSQPASDRAAFYKAASPLVEQALDMLDSKSLDSFDESDETLMRLLLTYAHVATAEEVQGPDEAKHALTRPRLPFTHAPADA